MLSAVAFNIEAREARRSKLLLESYWKFVVASDFGNGQHQSSLLLTCRGFMVIRNQATRLPWVTAAVKTCLPAMVEGVVLQGSGDKEVGAKWKPQNNLPAKLTLIVFRFGVSIS
ncbi:hypothetical protein V6N13_116079 [Hibiscus sabdariffa]